MKSDVPKTARARQRSHAADILFAVVSGFLIAVVPLTALFVLFAVLI
jgi:hypothetical protein